MDLSAPSTVPTTKGVWPLPAYIGFTPDSVPAAILTPGGVIAVAGDADEEYPGYSIHLNGRLAAVVEWHPQHQCFVLRTYTDDPAHVEAHCYHKWDGTPLVP